MNDFDYEVKQRKALARNAIHRKGGSKSKKCSLPSDHMTKAEWKKRNGEVMSYNLDRPIKYSEWRLMPDDLQREYWTKLREKFPNIANNRIRRDMLRISEPVLNKELERLGLPRHPVVNGVEKKHIHSKEWDLERWHKWLGWESDTPPEEDWEKPSPAFQEVLDRRTEKRDEKLAEIPKPRLDSLSFVINGANKQIELSIQDWLAMLPIGTYSVSIQITRNNHGT